MSQGVTFGTRTWTLESRTAANQVRRVLRAHAEDGGRCDRETLDRLVALARKRSGRHVETILNEFREETETP